jgi:membrane protein YdbS with pleckstrin-like domain
MPNDVKTVVSALVLIVAAILAYWSGSPVRHGLSTFLMVTAVFMVVSMWIFPEAGVKKGDIKK